MRNSSSNQISTSDHTAITLPSAPPSSNSAIFKPEAGLFIANLLLVGLCGYLYSRENTTTSNPPMHAAVWLAATSLMLLAQLLNLAQRRQHNPCLTIFKLLALASAGLFIGIGISLDGPSSIGKPQHSLS